MTDDDPGPTLAELVLAAVVLAFLAAVATDAVLTLVSP